MTGSIKYSLGFAATLVAGLYTSSAMAEDTFRIGIIEALSGPLAHVGDSSVKGFEYAAEQINKAGGINGEKVEIVPFDNKLSPQEAQIQLEKAIDQGIRYVLQGNGSSIAYALIDGIDKYNKRNPGKEVLYLNFSAVDPGLTNDKCSYWHFRFDADVDMKMAGLAKVISKSPAIKKIYLINQDYSFGHSVAEAAKKMIPAARPDIQFVGEDFHPIAKVKDFSPYIAKIQASGADTVVTGNWGSDLGLLIKAAKDGGLTNVDWLTFYGGMDDVTKVIGDAGLGRLKQITEAHLNIPNPDMEAYANGFHKEYPDLIWYGARVRTLMEMLAAAGKQAHSVEPVKIAAALENMHYETPLGEVWMRADDHQLFQPLYLSTWTKGVKYDVNGATDGTHYGFKTDARIEANDTIVPTTCKMKRPGV